MKILSVVSQKQNEDFDRRPLRSRLHQTLRSMMIQIPIYNTEKVSLEQKVDFHNEIDILIRNFLSNFVYLDQ